MVCFYIRLVHIACLLMAVPCHSYYDSQLRNTLTEIKQELQVLKNEVIKLGDRMDKMETTAEGQDTMPIVLEKVSKETVKDGLRYSVTYRAEECKEGEVTWMDTLQYNIGMQNISTVDLKNGRWENSAVFYSTNLSDMDLIVITSDGEDYRLGLRLRENKEINKEVQTKFNDVYIKIQPEGDLVYEQGENLRFTVTFPLSDTNSSRKRTSNSVDLRLQGIDPETNKFLFSFSSKNWYEILRTRSYESYKELDIELKTSEHPTSGMITFQTGISFPKDLVNFIEVQKSIVLRPSDQYSILPPDYIGLPVDPYARYDDNGTRLQLCPEGEPCHVKCKIAGENIAKISIAEILSDGSQKQLALNGSSVSKFLRIAEASVARSDDSDKNPKHYVCTGSSEKGDTVTEDISVTFFVSPEFDRSRSSVVTVDDEGNSTLSVRNITCTVRSAPQPIIALTLHFGREYRNFNPDNVTSLGNDEYVASKIVEYDANDTSGGKGKFIAAECIISFSDELRDTYGMGYYHYYEIPVLDSL